MSRKTREPDAIHPFDEIHGVDTSGLIAARDLATGHTNDEHVTAYYGVAPSILRTLVKHWEANDPPYAIADYSFVDIGAGKGRAMLVASQLGFRNVIGIELNPQLATVARENIAAWLDAHRQDTTAPALSPIHLLQQDALAVDLPAEPTVLFLFHPFEAPVLKRLLRRIEARFAQHPRELDVLYVNSECRDLLDEHPAFERLFLGNVAMSPEDHAADLAAIAQQKEYGSTGDEECAIYRYVGRSQATRGRKAAI
jgi:SAM-dependent methyltransferase